MYMYIACFVLYQYTIVNNNYKILLSCNNNITFMYYTFITLSGMSQRFKREVRNKLLNILLCIYKLYIPYNRII